MTVFGELKSVKQWVWVLLLALWMSFSRALYVINLIKINMNILKTICFFIARVKVKLYNILLFCIFSLTLGTWTSWTVRNNLCQELFTLSIIIILSPNHLYLWALKFIDLLKGKNIFNFVTFTGTFWNFCDIYWKKWHFLIFFVLWRLLAGLRRLLLILRRLRVLLRRLLAFATFTGVCDVYCRYSFLCFNHISIIDTLFTRRHT